MPVVDSLYIVLADPLWIRHVNYTDSLGIRHGGTKRELTCTISVVYRRQNNGMLRYMNIHQAQVQCFNVTGKFLFIFITLTILLTEMYLQKQRTTMENGTKR